MVARGFPLDTTNKNVWQLPVVRAASLIDDGAVDVKAVGVNPSNPRLPDDVRAATEATVVELFDDTSDATITPKRAAVRDEKYDVRRAGVVLDDATDNAVTLQAAVDIVDAANGGEVLFQPGVCRTSVAVDLIGKNGVKLRGVDLQAAGIKQTTLSTPVVRVGGSYQSVRDLQLFYVSASSTSGATALQMEGLVSFSEFKNLFIYNCHTGIAYGGAASPTGEFSNTWDNIRIGLFSAQAIRLVPTATGGTGSNWGNIYVSNWTGSVAGACSDYPVQITNHGGVINQLNIEWCNVTSPARDLCLFQQCHGLVINRLHMEGNVLPTGKGFIATFTTNESTVQINAIQLYGNTAASGSIGIVRPGAGTHIALRGVIVDNNTGIAASWYTIFDTSVATGAVVIIDELLDPDSHIDGFCLNYAGTAFARGHKGATAGEFLTGTVATVPGQSTGWGAPTGTATKTTFDTATVTTPQLAERVKALIDYLTSRGTLGA